LTVEKNTYNSDKEVLKMVEPFPKLSSRIAGVLKQLNVKPD